MITSLLFLTVSAFSTPLLENTAYTKNHSVCTLRVQEERFQEKVILALSSNYNSDFAIKIYHFNDLSAPSRGKLTQQPVFSSNHSNIDYLVDHNFFKRVNNNKVIYSTTIANDNIGPRLFIDTFKSHGNRSRIYVEGIDQSLSFVANHKLANDFYTCIKNHSPKT